MKNKTVPMVESSLVIKSTASLREEIIHDLIQPDKSLNYLLKEINEDETKNKSSFCDRGSNSREQ